MLPRGSRVADLDFSLAFLKHPLNHHYRVSPRRERTASIHILKNRTCAVGFLLVSFGLGQRQRHRGKLAGTEGILSPHRDAVHGSTMVMRSRKRSKDRLSGGAVQRLLDRQLLYLTGRNNRLKKYCEGFVQRLLFQIPLTFSVTGFVFKSVMVVHNKELLAISKKIEKRARVKI